MLRFLTPSNRIRLAIGAGLACVSFIGLDGCFLLIVAQPHIQIEPGLQGWINIAAPIFLLGLLASSLLLMLRDAGGAPAQVVRYSETITRSAAGGTALLLVAELIAFSRCGPSPLLLGEPTKVGGVAAIARLLLMVAVWAVTGLWSRQLFLIVELLSRRAGDRPLARRSAMLAWLAPTAIGSTGGFFVFAWLADSMARSRASDAILGVSAAIFLPVMLMDIFLNVAVLWTLARLALRTTQACIPRRE